MHDDLLQPTLAHSRPLPRLVSSRAQFFAAFFGGGFAALGLAVVNSSKLQRLTRDVPIVVLLAAVYVGFLYWLVSPAGAHLLAQFQLSRSGVPVRMAAVALFGTVYALHRLPLRAGALTGLDSASGWIAAAAAGAGIVLDAGLVILFAASH